MSWLLVYGICLVPFPPDTPSGLEARLRPLVDAHKGKVAVAVKHLGTGGTYFHNADDVMPTASLIKLPVLYEAFLQADEGKFKLTDRIILRDADKVPGSGILRENFSDGATFPVRDALRLMTTFSDNTATNLVLDRVGIAAVNRRMEAWGLRETRLNAKVFRGSTTSVDPERTRKYGLGSTTAREMVALLERLEKADGFRPAIKQSILGMLKRCDDKDKFPRFLPADVTLAHKTGTVSRSRTDAGLFYFGDHVVAVCVLTNENEDQRWARDNAGDVLCGKVAQEVVVYFRAKK